MGMFDFGRKMSCIVAFEEACYVLVDWELHKHRDIDIKSLKLQWKSLTKQRQIDTNNLPYALTKYSKHIDKDPSNLSLLNEFVENKKTSTTDGSRLGSGKSCSG